MKRMYSEEEIRELLKPKLIDSAEWDSVQEKWVWGKNAKGKLNHKYLVDYFDFSQDMHIQKFFLIIDDNEDHNITLNFDYSFAKGYFVVYKVDDVYNFDMNFTEGDIPEESLLQVYEL